MPLRRVVRGGRELGCLVDLASIFFPCCFFVVVLFLLSLHVLLIDLEKKGQLKKTLR